MPDNALSSVPVSRKGDTPTAHSETRLDGAGTEGVFADPKLAERIGRASAGAVDQHLAESPPGKRGQSFGKLPVGGMGDGADPASVEEGTPAPLGGVLASQPAFDEETTRQVIEIALGLLNDGASAVIRAIAKRETGDDKLADEAANSVRMTEKIEGTVKTGALACARKYAVNMAYAPEIMLGGGLIIWGGQVTMTGRALKAKGEELRQRAKEERKAA